MTEVGLVVSAPSGESHVDGLRPFAALGDLEGQLLLGGCEVHAHWSAGVGAEGDGFKIAMQILNGGRISIGALGWVCKGPKRRPNSAGA